MIEQQTPPFLYKLISLENWLSSQGEEVLFLSSFDDAFIHLATLEQVPIVQEKFWKKKPCVLLMLQTKKLPGNLVFETNSGGINRYYHLYDGFIPFSCILEHKIIENN